MQKITVRRRILTYLALHPGISADEIGHALEMSAASVRHHLSILTADGRVSFSGVRPSTGRGRPVKAYTLSEKSIGDNLANLSDILLRRWVETTSLLAEEPMSVIGNELAVRMGLLDKQVAISKGLPQVINKLNESHYQARWEASREGPRILFAHCPYAAIIEEHPELCQMDAAMLQKHFDLEAHQLTKIDRRVGGATHCIFTLG